MVERILQVKYDMTHQKDFVNTSITLNIVILLLGENDNLHVTVLH